MKITDGKEPLKDNEIADIISAITKITNTVPQRQRRVVISTTLTPILQNLSITKKVDCSKCERFNELVERVTVLEANVYRTEPVPVSYDDNNSCSVCGIKFNDMTHYVCSRADCPRNVTC